MSAPAPAPLTAAERLAAVAGCLDLTDLSEADRVRLAPRLDELWVAPGGEIFPETPAELSVDGAPGGEVDGLYVVVSGLVGIERRSEQRRAPMPYLLGPGGLFGEQFLGGGGMVAARAYNRCRLLRLRRADFAWARASLATFAVAAENLLFIHLRGPWIVEQLRRCPVLRHTPPPLLYELLEGAARREYARGESILAAGEQPGGLLMILRGEAMLADPDTGYGLRALAPGDVFGDLELLAAREAFYTATAATRTQVLRIRQDQFYSLLGRSSTFRRGVLSCAFGVPEQRQGLLGRLQSRQGVVMNTVAVLGDDPQLPLARLCEWAAEATAREFGDRVAVLCLEQPGPPVPEVTTVAVGDGEVIRIRVAATDPRLQDRAAAQALSMSADYAFVPLEGVTVQTLPPRVADAEAVVYVASRPYGELPPAVEARLSRPLLYTAVVPSTPSASGAAPIVPYGTVRIGRRLVEAARLPGGSFGELAVELREQVGRWARAITHRSVGLALGGGGPFGYAHLPLIRAIHAAGLPIDLVAGSSIGSVLGAYYATRGLAGVDQFFAEAGKVGKRLMPGAAWNSEKVSRVIGEVLGETRLEDLLVPFYPVAVDMDRACQVTIRHGAVGVGVRASCALPGPFAPMVLPQRQPGQPTRLLRLGDGGLLNMVPDDTLYFEGAQIVVASNAIPPPRARPEELAVSAVRAALTRLTSRLPDTVRARLLELHPLLRADDVVRTMYMLMHTPTDWQARAADAKYQATAGLFSPADWDRGPEIMKLQQPDQIELTVEQFREAYQALRWNRERAVVAWDAPHG